jgi:ornithine carbamoyltransferase
MNLISIFDLTHADLEWIIDRGEELKRERKTLKARNELAGKTLALIFEKPSTRTRVSFEVAMQELGGNVISLNWNELQLGRGERVSDTAKVLSSYVDAVMIRAYQHDTVVEFANSASIPVINGLTDFEHPCQTLADLMTIKEYKKSFAGVTVAWIGDGNNVCNSLIGGAALTGMHMRVGCPTGYAPAEEVLEEARQMGGEVLIVDDAEKAALDADVLYTDVWVSMGDEQERERRERDLRAYQLNENVVRMAREEAIIMHCMPVHVGEEITEGVLNSKNSVIFEQAENRLHAQKALLLRLFTS